MPVVKTEGRKRALKSLGTNKISVACPSKMCVEIKGTEVNVDFIRLHLGHKCEVTRMVLSNDERACIAGKYHRLSFSLSFNVIQFLYFAFKENFIKV